VSLPVSRLARIVLGAIAGLWITAVVEIAAAGGLIHLPVMLALFSGPLLVVALAALLFTRYRDVLMALPLPLLIGLNVFRLFGVWFLLLAAAGQLGGLFPYFAGIGDVVTGAFALPVAWLAARYPLSDWRIVDWNLFGLLDLIVAVSLGVTSHSPVITTLPWALIPLALVPVFMIGHVVIGAHQLARREAAVRIGTT